ncbi:putative thioredoxin peroxidase [Nosema granulosis]|uniref:Thioredoxin peroxidase n=1 Tax=Nosema granulosis TaxID=83296 RepID=A0A9P6H2A9_9MICR|nr:putative thioredoxin peroxidase [Nosema granulosis]
MYFPQLVEDVELPVFVDNEIKKIKLSDYKGDKYLVLMFYPLDFTFVCPTELNSVSDHYEDFEKRDATVLLISKDSVHSHKAWASLPRLSNGVEGCRWPMVSDVGGRLSKQFDLYDEEKDITKRATVILDKELNVFYYCVHHDMIGRSITELLRVVDAMDDVIKYGETCPMNWSKRN